MIHDRKLVGHSPDPASGARCAGLTFTDPAVTEPTVTDPTAADPALTAPVFAGLSPRRTAQLLQSFTTLTLRTAQTLPAHTDAWRVLIVQSGALAEEVPTRHGTAQLFGLVLPGELRSPMGHRLTHARFRALRDTTLRICSPDRLALLLTRSPRLRLRLLDAAQTCLSQTLHAQLLLGRMTAAERVAALVLSLWRRQGRAPEVPLLLNREEMGQLTGLTIETVSRQIRALARIGVITLPSPSRLRVLDEPGLIALTGQPAPRRMAA